ncbi:phage protein Gp27 family protein [Haemophilus parainfluenzae]|uniref:phage protein Gp27 family protein n=1 Tax=Haemophilus parainfluenzae TaxID=729 RepID=UPI00066BFD89|nr:phage protein Gp27 family protein [Haemophilus parainfluenzae]
MKTSEILHLPNDVKIELHKRLRKSNYSGFVELETWLRSLGYKTSKSGIHRYAKKLKDLDGFVGKSGSFELATQIDVANASEPNQSLTQLYQQLGQIEYQKFQILQKIAELKAGILP